MRTRYSCPVSYNEWLRPPLYRKKRSLYLVHALLLEKQRQKAREGQGGGGQTAQGTGEGLLKGLLGKQP